MKTKILPLVVFAFTIPATCGAANQLVVRAANKLPIARPNQTIELSAETLSPLGENNLHKIHVRDSQGKELLCQAVDVDYNDMYQADMVIFQSDFPPNGTQTFTVSSGNVQEFRAGDFKAYGRFVRERCDDFAWENDRIADRTYGKALETWKGEMLTSSSIDVWSKRTPNMVIDKWYMVGNYHTDTGEGCDDYSAGTTRGCGGNGLWTDDKLWVSKNFVDSRVLAAGPIRVMFELDYEPFDVNGVKVSEVKRITLDAGSQLNHFESFYKPSPKAGPLICGVGLKKVKGEQNDFDEDRGALVSWQPMEHDMGKQGVALIVDTKMFGRRADDKQNNLLLVKVKPDNSVSYWTGFAWDRAGVITSQAAWKAYVAEFADELRSPIEITTSVQQSNP